jgi:Sigma-70 region 2
MHGRQQGVKSPPVSKARDQHADEEERGLIQRLTAGDHEAFETLFQRYFTTVYRQAMRLSGQQAEAEEVVQEVFLTVYEKAHTFRGQSAFSSPLSIRPGMWIKREDRLVLLEELRAGDDIHVQAFELSMKVFR